MNIASAKLLQDSLQNAAANALRNRELTQQGEIERQRLAVDNAFRQAQMAHYNQMENRQQDYYNKMQQGESDRELLGQQNISREQQQNSIAQKQEILKTAMQLNSTGQLSDDARKNINNWLSTDSDFSKTGMQLNAPPNPSTDPTHVQTALAAQVGLFQKYQGMADSETNPQQKAEYQKIADMVYSGGKGTQRGTATSQRAEDQQEREDESQSQNNITATNPNAWFGKGGQYDPNATATLTQQDLTPITIPGLPLNVNGTPTGRPSIPQAHIAYLQANPSSASDFDAKYGQGASAQYLQSANQAAQ